MRARLEVGCLAALVSLGILGASCSDADKDFDADEDPGSIRGIIRSGTADYFDEGRAEKICRIQATGRPARSCQGQRHRDAGKQKRQSEHENGEYDRAHLTHVELLEHGNAHGQIAQVCHGNG